MPETGVFPSFSGPQKHLHPIQNRVLNKREMKRAMGYPEIFSFDDPNNECKVEFDVAVAQGVPVNFGKWISSQVKKGLDGVLNTVDAEIIFQNHIAHRYSTFDIDEFLALDEVLVKKGATKLEK